MGEKFIIFATASAAVTQLGCRNFGRCTFHPNDEAGYYLRACKLAASVARRVRCTLQKNSTLLALQLKCTAKAPMNGSFLDNCIVSTDRFVGLWFRNVLYFSSGNSCSNRLLIGRTNQRCCVLDAATRSRTLSLPSSWSSYVRPEVVCFINSWKCNCL